MIYHNGLADFEGLETAVRKTTKALRAKADKFDAIIVQGVSGQCVGFPLALRLKVPIAVLRKQGEDCHALQGTLINRQAVTGKRVLFVDDFIATGETRDRCREAVATAGGELVGSFTYRRGKFSLDPEIKYDDVNHAPF